MALSVAIVAASAPGNHVHAFVTPSPFCSTYTTARRPASPESMHPHIPAHPWNPLQMVATASYPDLEEEISAMRMNDIRQELESYGVSTNSFFEKSELVKALAKARKEENNPSNSWDDRDTFSTNRGESGSSNESTGNGDKSSTKNGWFQNLVDRFSDAGGSSSNGATRTERIKQEKEKCKKLKVKELRKELESYGVSTKSYFEKSEFENAVAEARVDGTRKSATSREYDGAGWTTTEEPWDPAYRDVVVTKFDAGLLSGIVIDV